MPLSINGLEGMGFPRVPIPNREAMMQLLFAMQSSALNGNEKMAVFPSPNVNMPVHPSSQTDQESGENPEDRPQAQVI